MMWCINTYTIVYVKIQKNEDILSIMSNLQPNSCLKVDFQKVDQHAGGKWLIHDTKRRKDNVWHAQNVKFLLRYNWYFIKHLEINHSNGLMDRYLAWLGLFSDYSQHMYCKHMTPWPWSTKNRSELHMLLCIHTVLTWHQRGLLAVSWGQFHINSSRYHSLQSVLISQTWKYFHISTGQSVNCNIRQWSMFLIDYYWYHEMHAR